VTGRRAFEKDGAGKAGPRLDHGRMRTGASEKERIYGETLPNAQSGLHTRGRRYEQPGSKKLRRDANLPRTMA